MTIYSNYLEQVCKDMTHKLNLHLENKHIATIFKDNNSQQIIGWAILDENNDILERYNDIQELYNAHINN
jgi:hypothetical protein